jgi:dTDP-4-amino-4,6-dideoxygalactose transaminase
MARTERIFLSPPHISGNERTYVAQAFDSNYIAPLGPMVDAFEQDFCTYTGFKHAVALTSGTAAIHLALRGLGIGQGDLVYASTLTFIGSVAPILYQNATPVFLDADAQSWCMDTALLEEALTKANAQNRLPKAIIPTDLYGQSCDVDAITTIAARYGIPVIIDAAESVGAHYKGRHAGLGAEAAAFSFNGNKIITSSGGGMLASNNAKLIAEARFLSQQARDPAPHYEHHTYGYNYRMSNIVAAIGRAQLEVIEERVAARRAIYARYAQGLSDLTGVQFVPEISGMRHTRWLSVMLLNSAAKADRETVRQALEAQNIESRPMWKPMHLQPVFADAVCIGGSVSEQLFAQGLCLPSGSALTEETQCEIIAHLRQILT